MQHVAFDMQIPRMERVLLGLGTFFLTFGVVMATLGDGVGTLCFIVAFCTLLLAAIAVATRIRRRVDGFSTTGGGLTDNAGLYANARRCYIGLPVDFSLSSEGLALHPTSSSSDPKCLVVGDAMGLLTDADPEICRPKPDLPQYGWKNPLNHLGGGSALTSLQSDVVGNVKQCVLRVSNSASATDVDAADRALALAGSQITAGTPQANAAYAAKHDDAVSKANRAKADAAAQLETARQAALWAAQQASREASARLQAEQQAAQRAADDAAARLRAQQQADAEAAMQNAQQASQQLRSAQDVARQAAEQTVRELQAAQQAANQQQAALQSQLQAAQAEAYRREQEAARIAAERAAAEAAARAAAEAAARAAEAAARAAAERAAAEAAQYWANQRAQQAAQQAAQQRAQAERNKAVTIYQHCDYQGYSLRLGVGSYNMGSLLGRGMQNDDISSITFQGGARAALFEHDGFQGRRIDFDTNVSCFVNYGFNDVLSSLVVY